MFGVRIWHPDDCQVLGDEVWDAMKAAIRKRDAAAKRTGKPGK